MPPCELRVLSKRTLTLLDAHDLGSPFFFVPQPSLLPDRHSSLIAPAWGGGGGRNGTRMIQDNLPWKKTKLEIYWSL